MQWARPNRSAHIGRSNNGKDGENLENIENTTRTSTMTKSTKKGAGKKTVDFEKALNMLGKVSSELRHQECAENRGTDRARQHGKLRQRRGKRRPREAEKYQSADKIRRQSQYALCVPARHREARRMEGIREPLWRRRDLGRGPQPHGFGDPGSVAKLSKKCWMHQKICRICRNLGVPDSLGQMWPIRAADEGIESPEGKRAPDHKKRADIADRNSIPQVGPACLWPRGSQIRSQRDVLDEAMDSVLSPEGSRVPSNKREERQHWETSSTARADPWKSAREAKSSRGAWTSNWEQR